MDIDLSVLALKGEIVAWTVQSWNEDKILEFSVNARCCALGREIIARTNFHGLAHFDMRIDDRDGTIKIIECNPRFWSSVAASMWQGTNFTELGVEAVMGEMSPTVVEPTAGQFTPDGVFLRRALRA